MNTITAYWQAFQKRNPAFAALPEPQSFYYCDNKKDADECAELVVSKIKQATSPSLWWFEKHNEPLPRVGDLAIVTNWERIPKAIVRTTKVEVLRFKDVTEAYAFIEGEGDRSLDYWKAVHWDYYANEMKPFGEFPAEDMKVVCEYFETIG